MKIGSVFKHRERVKVLTAKAMAGLSRQSSKLILNIILHVNWFQPSLVMGPRLSAQFLKLLFSIHLYLVNIVSGSPSYSFVLNSVLAEV